MSLCSWLRCREKVTSWLAEPAIASTAASAASPAPLALDGAVEEVAVGGIERISLYLENGRPLRWPREAFMNLPDRRKTQSHPARRAIAVSVNVKAERRPG